MFNDIDNDDCEDDDIYKETSTFNEQSQMPKDLRPQFDEF